MKTLKDYEKQLEGAAFCSHHLNKTPDVIGVESALMLIEEAAKNSFERGYCSGILSKPNVTVNELSEELKTKWTGIQDWFDKEFGITQ